MNVKVVIPFRDRGTDPRRAANLEVVMAWWWAHGLIPTVVSDGLEGDAQFNRHRAYNRAVEEFPETDAFVFTEADMILPPMKIATAVRLALRRPGLIVPFTQYRYLSDADTAALRDRWHDADVPALSRWFALPEYHPESIFSTKAEAVMNNGSSIGAVNVISRRTLELTGGFTEATSGNWYDDNIIEEAFAYLTDSHTRYVPGPALHLYHLPGWKGDHLTSEDRAATQRNKFLLTRMRIDISNNDRLAVRTLLGTRDPTGAR